MSKVIALEGRRFGRLTVLRRNGADRKKAAMWLCRCDCGAEVTKRGQLMMKGESQSCGCLRRDATKQRFTKHGHAGAGRKTKTYMIWASMIQRCHNPSAAAFKDYGARGIQVCKEWRESFAVFLTDVRTKPAGKSLDRIDNAGSYEPRNVEWTTPLQQASHTRKTISVICDGVKMPLSQFARKAGIKYDTARYRVSRGVRSFGELNIELVGSAV